MCTISTMCSRWIAVILKSYYYGLNFGTMQGIPPIIMFLLLGKNVYILIIGIYFFTFLKCIYAIHLEHPVHTHTHHRIWTHFL